MIVSSLVACRRRRRLWGVPAALLYIAMSGGLLAMETGREHTLKAGFLLNFGQFTTWPRSAFATPQSPFVIGVIGPDPFGAMLDAVVDGVSVGGRRVEIRRLATGDEIATCHVLFVGIMDAREQRRLMDLAGALPVLTVGDGDAFLAAGGMVAFRIDKNRVRFDVNPVATRRAGLVLSSEMLQFARLVTP